MRNKRTHQNGKSGKNSKRKDSMTLKKKIKKLNEQNDKLWDDFNKTKEAYWKQKHYVDWIEWQMKVKTRKINEVER